MLEIFDKWQKYSSNKCTYNKLKKVSVYLFLQKILRVSLKALRKSAYVKKINKNLKVAIIFKR